MDSARVIAEVFRGASKGAIGTALALAGAGLTFGSLRLPRRNDVLERLAEVLEASAIVAFSGSAAVFLSMTELRAESIVVIIAAPLIGWGWWRSTAARFVGSVALCVGVPMFALGSAQLIHSDSPVFMACTMLVAGAALWAAGQRDVGAAFLQRVDGCYFILMGSFILMGELNDAGKIIPIVTGAILFVLGSSTMQVESLGAGAIAVTVGMTVAMGEWLPSEFTRGLTTIAVGVAMLVAVGAQLRRGKGQHPAGPSLGQSTRA